MTTSPGSSTLAPADLAETAAALRLAVGRLSRRMRQESAAGHGLTQIGILFTLHRQGVTTLGDLAAVERVAPPTITKAVATLVSEGLVEKLADPADKRVSRAQLTAAGARAVQDIRQRRDAWLATRLTTLVPGDVARLADVLPLLEALTADEPTAPADGPDPR